MPGSAPLLGCSGWPQPEGQHLSCSWGCNLGQVSTSEAVNSDTASPDRSRGSLSGGISLTFRSCVNDCVESDPPQFSRIYPGSCWASTYPQLFLYLLKRLVQTQPLSERGGMLRGPGLFKQDEPCGERCLWHVTVVMRIIAEHIPPI